MLKEGIFVSLVASSRCEFHKEVKKKKKTIKTIKNPSEKREINLEQVKIQLPLFLWLFFLLIWSNFRFTAQYEVGLKQSTQTP